MEKKITFIHGADFHLGRSFPYDSLEKREEGRKDRFQTFQNMVEDCQRRQVDFLFLVGDIFEQELFQRKDGYRILDALRSLRKTMVFFLLGNHDYKLENFLEENAPENVYIFPSGEFHTIEIPEYNVSIMGESWGRETFQKKLSILSTDVREKGRNILLHHGMWGGDSYFPLDIPLDLHKKFSYIGFGHIHKPMEILENAYMVGTPEILDYGDKGHRGWIYGEIDESLRVEFIPASGKRIEEKQWKIWKESGFQEIQEGMKSLGFSKEGIYELTWTGEYPERGILEGIQEHWTQSGYTIRFLENLGWKRDYEGIYRQYKDTLLGRYLEEISRLSIEDKMKQEMIDVGIEAFLKGERR
ncbi:metallophosphoesterase [Peptoniphilus sp. KCTC 25270]|uniref:metallophosphoesterase family protein n=1 Tax=Peptoniphilus sp. KCTC 25270 TaxID=2897414 RepID=UPI001E5BE4C7|nr:metallophosphoesterase [Peptoniphilus sp. KCTC 25270]MCD1147226.1 metallophosphoesterase [Peptoniphilus sp. KCTC 25270]